MDPDYESDSADSEDEGKSGYRKGGYHPVCVGERYHNRYTIEKKLGWGHFSTVWLASDSEVPDDHPHKLVALKIQKSASQYVDAAMDEIELLTMIRKKKENCDTVGANCVVELLNHFVVYGVNGKHICLVFETMGPNLLSLIKRYDYQGVPLAMVKVITKQILEGLHFLHTQAGIIHTDLKPENFLLAPLKKFDLAKVQENRRRICAERRKAEIAKLANFSLQLDSKVKVTKNEETSAAVRSISEAADVKMKEKRKSVTPRKICLGTKIADLGNACWIHKHFTDDVTTRQYRSPEVIVGYPYGTPIDVWSLACLVFELLTGDYLFDPKADANHKHTRNEDHLALMMELIGQMPPTLAQEGKHSRKLFNSKGKLRNIRELDNWALKQVLADKYKMEGELPEQLASFLMPMLTLDPNVRVTAEEALKHPFLQGVDVNEVFDDVGRPRRSRNHKSESKPKATSSESKTNNTPATTTNSSSASTTSTTSASSSASSGSTTRGGMSELHLGSTVADESQTFEPPESPSSASATTFIVSHGSS